MWMRDESWRVLAVEAVIVPRAARANECFTPFTDAPTSQMPARASASAASIRCRVSNGRGRPRRTLVSQQRAVDRLSPNDAILCKLMPGRMVDAERVERLAEAAPVRHS